jgi:MFS transporter, DHA1 family, multidrug resistance protein
MATRLRPTIAVSLVYASTAVVMASYALLAVALPFRFQALGLSVVQYGIALAVFALGMLVTESVWGVLAFRIGSARTIVVLGVAVALVYLGIGVSDTFSTITVSLGLLGALVIFQVPLMRWMALTALGPGTGGRGTGIYGLFFGAGLAVGTALGPVLFVEFGFIALIVLIVASYAVGLGLMIFLPWDQVVLPPKEPGFARHVREVCTRPFASAAGLVAVAFIAQTLVTNFLQYYSVSVFHGTPSEAGYVIGAARGTSLVAGALLGGLVDRWGPARSAPFGFALLILGAVGTLFSSSYAEMIGGTIIFATGVGWLSASLLPLALGPVPLRLQGTAVGVFGSFEDFGLLVGPVLISAVYATYGARRVFVVVAAVALAGVLLSLLLRPSDRGRPLGIEAAGLAER